eukprot:EC721510.1.p1 GENE.EC721510.1~~EC721510.1.p1  ORF type:complete len:119 (+),score=7.41 EC721510.1:108-464(+)
MQIASPRAPSLIEYQDWRFRSIDSETEANVSEAVEDLQKFHVRRVGRVCVEGCYSDEPRHQLGVETREFSFPDGEAPAAAVIEKWVKLVHDVFVKKSGSGPDDTIAVHCVAGLGRAPV